MLLQRRILASSDEQRVLARFASTFMAGKRKVSGLHITLSYTHIIHKNCTEFASFFFAKYVCKAIYIYCDDNSSFIRAPRAEQIIYDYDTKPIDIVTCDTLLPIGGAAPPGKPRDTVTSG